jgi:YCII-related domain
MPSEELLLAMAKFNEEMVKAGVMLDANGLQPSSKGARVRFSGDKRTVIDGPFAETKELVAGYTVVQVKVSGRRCDAGPGAVQPHQFRTFMDAATDSRLHLLRTFKQSAWVRVLTDMKLGGRMAVKRIVANIAIRTMSRTPRLFTPTFSD